MEAHLDQPLPPRQLAARAGISVRQLERLIASRFHDTPGGYYLKLRLQAARNHLFYGDMPIQEIAMATGFSSPVGAVALVQGTVRAEPRGVPRPVRARTAAALPAGGAAAVGAGRLTQEGSALAGRNELDLEY